MKLFIVVFLTTDGHAGSEPLVAESYTQAQQDVLEQYGWGENDIEELYEVGSTDGYKIECIKL